MSCKGRCATMVVRGHGHYPYLSGFKYCRNCEGFLRHDGARCPCCNAIMRIRPVVKVLS